MFLNGRMSAILLDQSLIASVEANTNLLLQRGVLLDSELNGTLYGVNDATGFSLALFM